jgi:hypothetical protein
MSVIDASRIIIDDFIVTLQIVASLTDNSRGIIYNCNRFIVEAEDNGNGNYLELIIERSSNIGILKGKWIHNLGPIS